MISEQPEPVVCEQAYQQLSAEFHQLQKAHNRRLMELTAFKDGAKAILAQKSFSDTARAIFDYCRRITGATSGYVALLSPDGRENEVLFLEAGGLPCDVNPALPMPIRGLREQAYRTNAVVFENNFMASEWVRFMPPGHVDMRNVLFAPLVLQGHTVGIMGLANKDGDFDEDDVNAAAIFGELAAIALENSRNMDRRTEAEAEQHRLIGELQESLANVKLLRGLLPICAWCKKIRDDQGYWTKLEEFIHHHSEAEFSHSICPTCMEKYFPEVTQAE